MQQLAAEPSPVRPAPSVQGGKKYDELMKFMEDIEDEITSQFERSSQRQKKQQRELDDVLGMPSDISGRKLKANPINSTALVKVNDDEIFNKAANVNPREAYQKVRERMMELEIERDE